MSDARPDARSAPGSATFPLTPAQALAVAAMIDTHPNPLPHWAGWVKALRTWAAAEFEAVDDEPLPPALASFQASIDASRARSRAAGETR